MVIDDGDLDDNLLLSFLDGNDLINVLITDVGLASAFDGSNTEGNLLSDVLLDDGDIDVTR